MSRKLSSILLGTLPAVAAHFCTTAAIAQEDGAIAIEEVVAVGTRSRNRSVQDSPVPVDIITADDLARSPNIGAELGSLLQSAVPSFSMPRQSNSDQTDVVRSAQLRGLSPDQVLVLVNGKRRHINSVISTESKVGRGSAAVDFNNIPTSAIERIEVLRDGAAAQYGSDAIAGVINIVLKDASEDGDVSVSYGAHLTEQDSVGRDITDGQTFTISANHGFSIGDRGFFNISGEYRDRASTNRAGLDQLPTIGFAEFIAPVPPSGTPAAAANDALAGLRNYRQGDGESEDINLMFNAGYDLNTEFQLYGFGSYSSREAEGYNFFRYPVSANTVRSVYPRGFVPLSDIDIDDYSIGAGIRGAFANGWLVDASVVHGANEFSDGLKNSINSSLGPASPTEFDTGEYDYSQTVVNLDLSRKFELAIPFNLAAGLEFRLEDYSTEAGDPESFAAGSFDACLDCVTFGNSDTSRIGSQGGAGLQPSDEVDADRFAFSAYVDVDFDITDEFLLSVAGRFEDYNDFGDTLNGKVAARYELLPGFAIRGSVSTGFRAPSLAQAFFAGTTTSFGTGGGLVSTLSLPVGTALAQANGAVELDAEESLNKSIGFTWAHELGFTLSFDYYEVDIDDRIALSQNIPVADVAGVSAVRFFTNVADTETSGFDVVATYTHKEWQFSAAYNKSDTDVVNNPDRAIFGIEEKNTFETAPPEDTLILTAGWERNRFSALVRGIRFGETERIFDFGDGFEPQQVFGAEWSLDADFRYQLTDNWAASVGGNNLLDEYPDESIFDISFFGNLPHDVLSPIGVNGRFVYLKTTFSY